MTATAAAPTRLRAEHERFGSRAWARALVTERGDLAPSGRHRRIEVDETAPPSEAQSETRRAGRHRILPCRVFLSTAIGSRELFPAGPFDEFRCAQRRVSGGHEVEFLTRLDPRDAASEAYRPFARFDLRGPGQPLPRLSRERAFWAELASRHGLRALPRPRLRSAALADGQIALAAGVTSGVFQRPGQAPAPYAEILDLLRATCAPAHWIAWLETAFPAAPSGAIVHRYYLDADLEAYLVRDHWRDGKTIRRAIAADDAPGLWIHTGATRAA